ncbi:hypothetical protein ZIOFF_059864 [Zingiber officinale]|uniref:Phosphofructokinase domain-containing protein n=1 Tax=Zingiber officinale TaxID=94328 RepID=A0A8J5F5H2_ZINOF|nr:hypothetical protein ZIOFF_059864 [Zingiber officinale]
MALDNKMMMRPKLVISEVFFELDEVHACIVTCGGLCPGLNMVIDKSFGFDTAVEEAQRAINAAHVEAESVENGIGLVKLMGRYSGFIAMYATLASRDVVHV